MLRASGEVLLSLVVQSDRVIRDIQVVESAGYGMDEEAVETVKKWRFEAGTKDGTPVDVRFQVRVRFGIATGANTWRAGPLLFDDSDGVKPPSLKSGSMPKAMRETGDETVLLQFTVGRGGEVGDIRPLQDQVPAQYPDSARLARVQGIVLLTVTIGVDGSVKVKDLSAISICKEISVAIKPFLT